MLRLDFWNNPIVVTAFRVKYRRGAPAVTASLWLLVLLGVGGLLHHYQAALALPWERVFLTAVLGLQTALTAIWALAATNASLQSEVAHRTLDYQRIAALSPRQILLGKMLGEPAGSYLWAIATVPIAMLCCGLGAASVPVVLLLYVHMITTGLMCGALGLIHSLDPEAAAKAGGGKAVGGVVALGIMALFFVPGILMNAASLSSNPIAGLCFGCVLPILSIQAVAIGEPWMARLELWGVGLPFLIVGPLFQLAIAAVCFETMTRKTTNPLNTAMSKPQAYVALLAGDLLAAGLVRDVGLGTDRLDVLAAEFWAAHVVLSFLFVRQVTPMRETFFTWVWRLRARMPWWKDSLLGERSENTLVLPAFCAIGAVIFALAVVLPRVAAAGPGQMGAEELTASGVIATVSCVVILALGFVWQWFVVVAGRPGSALYYLAVGMLLMTPILVGIYYDRVYGSAGETVAQAEFCRSLSPVAYWGRWIGDPTEPLSPVPVLVIYSLLAIVGLTQARRRIRQLCCVVDRKLAAMGAKG